MSVDLRVFEQLAVGLAWAYFSRNAFAHDYKITGALAGLAALCSLVYATMDAWRKR